MNDSPHPCPATEGLRSKPGVGVCLLSVLGSVKAGGPTWGSQKESLEEATGRTCPHGSPPFQQQLEAVQLAVECSTVQRGVSIHRLGIQVATKRGGLQ